MKNIKFISFALLGLGLTFNSCKKSYLETSPSNAITNENLFTSTQSSYQVIDGIARVMNTTGASYEMAENAGARANDFGEAAVRHEEDMLAQDVVTTASNYDWFTYCYNYVGIRQPLYNVAQLSWRLYYKLVNASNTILANIDNATGPEAEKNNIKGQAYAYRAYAYYKLSLFYCKTYSLGRDNPGLPIYLEPTTGLTIGKGRSSLGEVYDLIVSDLENAKTFLEAGGVISGRPKSDISIPTMYGIYAKVALVMQNWTKAEEMASKALNTFGTGLMSQNDYKAGFNNKDNVEWMWASNITANQRQDMGNKNFMSFVDPSNTTSYGNVGVTRLGAKFLLDQMRTFPDVRKETFDLNNGRQQTKFRLADPNTWEYDLLYMRTAEMYLIKAEALAELGRDADAITTLNTLVQARNPGYDYNNTLGRYHTAEGVASRFFGRTSLLKEIYLQRRIELFMEGVAYSDIQRLGSGLDRPTGAGNHVRSVAQTLKLPAGSDNFLFKIPQQEMDANPALAGQQNP